jgi:signal recognition particle subunit SRP54
MLGLLTDKMQELFSKLARKQKLTEDNIAEAVSEVRLALLEADVNYSVAKTLIKRVKEKALGHGLIKSVSPGQQFMKIVHDELVALMGGGEAELNLEQPLAVFMVCGLQGSGKTTQCAKLAKLLKKQGKAKKPLLAACDLQRPAAVEQLRLLGEQINVPTFLIPGESNPIKVAKAALEKAKSEAFDVLIVDTAGRLHIDEELMEQLGKVRGILSPNEVLFVANATTGQDAVNVAVEFNKRVEITGTILTMLDGNTRGGAAISIREATGKPLKFEGTGEKLDDLQVFSPTSMADRILGMGDTINLVRKAQEHINEEDAKNLEKKIVSATFNYQDYLTQMQMVKKLGPLKTLLSMLPGMGNALKDMPLDESKMRQTEAIIHSMTPAERSEKCELVPSRRKRLAKGSGTSVEDVNKFIKSFKETKQIFKNVNMKNLEKMMGGSLWR